MTRKFQRRTEDFTCRHCGHTVTGNGYTNHCPACLYSCHVDISPGDRAADCGGLMSPIGLESKNGGWVILHRCQRCGHEMRCKTMPDDMAAVLRLAKQLADPR